jgi:L-lactate utilization protein LutC
MTNSPLDYSKLASKNTVNNTITSLKEKNYAVTLVRTKAEALEKIKALIPAKAAVMSGASVTLEQIGFMDYMASEKHDWIDLRGEIRSENDELKRHELRKQSVMSDYYLGSVHALTETGDMLIASNTGSQLPNIVSTSPNLIFVVSTKKIVPNVSEAMSRLEKHVIPLEDKHMMDLYKVHTALNKIVIFKGDAAFLGRKIQIILVEEDLGF